MGRFVRREPHAGPEFRVGHLDRGHVCPRYPYWTAPGPIATDQSSHAVGSVQESERRGFESDLRVSPDHTAHRQPRSGLSRAARSGGGAPITFTSEVLLSFGP